MTFRPLALPFAVLLLAVGILTGCAPGGSGGGSGDAGSAGSASGGSGGVASTPCAGSTDASYVLASDPAMSVTPPAGAVFGDGSVLAFRYDANDESRSPVYGYDLAYIQQNGSVAPLSGAFATTHDGTDFTFGDSVFQSETDGHEAFLTVSVTQDPAGGAAGDPVTTPLGVYCVTLKVAP